MVAVTLREQVRSQKSFLIQSISFFKLLEQLEQDIDNLFSELELRKYNLLENYVRFKLLFSNK